MNLQYVAAKSVVILLYDLKKQKNVHQSQKHIFLSLFFLCFSEQWQETTLSVLLLSFIVYWRARNKAEEGSCVSQRGGMAYPGLGLCTHTHSWSWRTHGSERLLFRSRLIKVTCLCAEEPFHSCWRLNTSSSEGFTGMQSFLSRTNTLTHTWLFPNSHQSVNLSIITAGSGHGSTVNLLEDCILFIVCLFISVWH